jgi:hypothetical protein
VIKPDEYGGGGPPAVTADFLEMEAGDVTVLTIKVVEPNVNIPQPGTTPRKVLVLRFKEYPARAYYTNKTSVRRLVGALGDNEKKWIDQKVPLYCLEQVNPQSEEGETALVLWICDPALWSKHIKGFGRAAAKATAKPKRR